MTLGLLWILILTYNKRHLTKEDQNLEKALTIWINRHIKGHKGLEEGFRSFTKDLRSGLVLSALLHSFGSESVDYAKVYADYVEGKESDRERLERVLQVAET